ncbi:hypothetical protein Rxycam_02291 [Rubrobacter xylanophilus DSM 9941]|uniref:bifunctional DedA family/phosphatase PAP2 family protein n=1 Tax=Rubrobacter xylanophilus TaxID=49319 RepID=UPI001C63C3EE|nr:bifunctional DedA family/phosphatase PAP2 family protein [Rubrobacter xylanophilus]QYJ16458.1 hypothetical protein Rxycam_02291 [Rubrobacter xylanophilus DSM 9941]
MDPTSEVISLLSRYGYLVVFFGVMAESAGIPLPGETILLAAGALAQRGVLDPADVLLFGFLGAVAGDQLGYWIGRRGGRRFVLRWGRRVRLTPERLAAAERFFDRHGGKAVFLARFVAGLRVFGALVAGIGRMRWGTFLVYNALGGAVWASAAVLAGYLLGGSLALTERWAGRAGILLALAAVTAALLYLLYRWLRRHRELLESIAGRLMEGLPGAFLRSRVGRWLVRRFSPGGVYGLTLTAGLVLVGLFSWAFGGIVEDVVTRDPLVRVDLSVLRFVHAHGEPGLTAAVATFEAAFSPEVLLPAAALSGLGLLLLAGLGWRAGFREALSGAVLLASALGTGALVLLFKLLFDRPRPPIALQLVHETGQGFPSGHAMAAFTVGAAVCYAVFLREPGSRLGSWRAKVRAAVLWAALVLLVGAGRVYTGAHYPSDVLAGWALGGAWASVCITAAEVFRRLRAQKVLRGGVA